MGRIMVDVLRNTLGDGTKNGLTARYDSVLLAWGDDLETLKDSVYPVLKVVERTVLGETRIQAEPLQAPLNGMVGPMFGGNFVWTSDGNFPYKYPIPVHDRYETKKEYATYD